MSQSLASPRTLWGRTAVQLHDEFWLSRGVKVVRPGMGPDQIQFVANDPTFLLLDRDVAAFISVRRLADWLYWAQPRLMWLRMRRSAPPVADPASTEASPLSAGRAALTSSYELAREWSQNQPGWAGWRSLRRQSRSGSQLAFWTLGRTYTVTTGNDEQSLGMALIQAWRRPDSTIKGIHQGNSGVWCDDRSTMAPGLNVSGSAWIGARWHLGSADQVKGPAILWDKAEAKSI